MKKFYLVLSIVSVMIGCERENSTRQQATDTTAYVVKHQKPVIVTGMARIEKRRVTSGKLEVSDINGMTLVSASFKDSPKFSIEIPAGASYPAILTVYPEAIPTEMQALKVVVMNPYSTDQVVTPVTTAIAEKALALGGYTPKNMMRAARETSPLPNRDTTVEGFSGDPTTKFGGWH